MLSNNGYKFTVMPELEPEWAQCFDSFDEDPDGWSQPEIKCEVAHSLCDLCSKYGVDISDMTTAFCQDVRFFNPEYADEVGFFDMAERMLNAKGVYTYNSDTWFEVYGTGVEITAELEELLED